jgi:hypothetical protein
MLASSTREVACLGKETTKLSLAIRLCATSSQNLELLCTQLLPPLFICLLKGITRCVHLVPHVLLA